MSGLSLEVKISANARGLRNGLKEAKARVSDFNSEVEKSAKKRQAINQIGNAFGKVGLAAGLAAAVSVKKFADFDQAMSAVKATGDDAAKSMDALRAAALKAGADTAFNATESAAAVENLAKAGVSAADILGGGLKGSLDLAAAGGLGVAEAAEYAAIAMTQFNLKGTDVPHVADLLAAGAGKANGEVSDLGQALNQAGLVASQMGVSIEETTGTLAAFAAAGLLGSDAGTSFKSMLLRLANPSKESAKLMEKFGISTYDAQGNMVSMGELAGQLQDAFKGQTQATRDAALAQIFGSDAVRAANVLYKNGQKGIDGWTAKVNDAGYASKTAATRMDNLKGDWEQLTGALETALIGTGEGANGPLRDVLQNLTELIDAYNDLSPAMKSFVGRGLAVTAMLGGTGFAISRAITGYAALKKSMIELGVAQDNFSKKSLAMRGGALVAGVGLMAMAENAGESSKAAQGLMEVGGAALMGFGAAGPVGGALATGGLLIQKLATYSTEAEKRQGALADRAKEVIDLFDQQTGAETAAAEAAQRRALAKDGTLDKAKSRGLNLGDVVSASLGDEAAMARVTKQIQKQTDALRDRTEANSPFKSPIPSKTDLGQKAGPAQLNKGDRDLLGGLGIQANEVRKFREEITLANQAAYQQAGAFSSVAMILADSAGGVNKYVGALTAIPKDVQTRVAAAGAEASRADVMALAKAYNLTPEEVMTKLLTNDLATGKIRSVDGRLVALNGRAVKPSIKVDTSSVAASVNYAQRLINGMNGKTVRVAVSGGSPGGITKADGGAIVGPGTGRSDSIAARLSNGEHVITAAEVKAAGGQGAVYAWRRAIRQGAPAFAGGGAGGYANGGVSGGSSSIGPLEARLVDPTVRMEANGLLRLVDSRVQIGAAQSARDSAAASRRRGTHR